MKKVTDPDLDLDQLRMSIGDAVLRLPVISASVGHSRCTRTLRDYARPEALAEPSRMALSFLRDVLTLPVDEVLAKWYEPGRGGFYKAPGLDIGARPLDR